MKWLSVASVDDMQLRKGQMLNSGELPQLTNHWYVTASDGDVLVRVFPGMWLGETETGDLSLEGSDAMLSLSIGTDELLAVFVLNGGELDSEDGEFSGRRHLALDSAAQIRLPNNTLRFDRDIMSDAGSDVLTRAVWRKAAPEIRAPATGSVGAATLSPSLTEVIEEVIAAEPSTPEHDQTPNNPLPTEPAILKEFPEKPPVGEKKRRKAVFATAAAGLACVLIGLIYQGTRTLPPPEQAEQAEQLEANPPQIADVESSFEPILATSAEASRQSPVQPTVVPEEQEPLQEIQIATAETEIPETTELIAPPSNDLMTDDITSSVAAATPLPQNRPTAEVLEPTETRNTGSQRTDANAVNRREIARAERASRERKLRQEREAEAALRREQEQLQTARVTYERDLLAAELALAQGRLTQPAENSAYALYKQLVTSHPESADARRGFQALGAALVNRAFAEIAAKQWNDARATLAAAAEAGASPNLVADLSGEVAYQQRLADAQAGRFATLHPPEELVALNRTTPPLRSYAPDGVNSVQIEFTVSTAGNVQDLEVLDAPPQRLERAVREAVTDWRFEPVLFGTRPIPVRTRVGLEIP